MQRKKILAVLLAAAVLALPGCSSNTADQSDDPSAKNITIEADGSSSENETDGSESADEGSGEAADEQEAGAAQEAADEIDQLHADGKETVQTSVERGSWDGKILEMDETGSWVRQSSEEDGKGGFEESYICDADGRLEYTWSCVPESVSDGAAFTEDYIQNCGWTAASVTLNEDVAADLGMDAYEYTAYEDDNGYSMLHRGVLIADDDTYYTADFRMMEGDMGQYETSVQEWLSSLYLA